MTANIIIIYNTILLVKKVTSYILDSDWCTRTSGYCLVCSFFFILLINKLNKEKLPKNMLFPCILGKKIY